MTDLFSLSGKTAIVTGGAQGIGAAIVERLRAAGASVIVGDLNVDATDPMSKKTDVSREDNVQALINHAITQTGRLDIVVNNAGVHSGYDTLDQANETDLAKCIAVNTNSVMFAMKHAGPKLEEGGAIVNISSVSAVLGVSSLGTYAASKSAVLALTKVAAMELAARKIRVNAICPGSVRTPMALADGGEDLLNVEAAATPLGRICEPEEVAALVHALVASDCSFLTGQAINLDGGLSAGISDGVWQAVAG
jgi:NAD(P)-dependent dehydrogenase (short-subunit alcohol dehydrogenase family)